MSKIITPTRVASLGFAFAAGLAVFSAAGTADAAVGNRFCETHSANRTMKCCTAHMRSNADYRSNITGISCNRAVIVCKKVQRPSITNVGGSTTVCYVSQLGKFKRLRELGGGGEHRQPPSTSTQNSPNTPGAAAGNTRP